MRKLELCEVKKRSSDFRQISQVTGLLSRRARFGCKILDPTLLQLFPHHGWFAFWLISRCFPNRLTGSQAWSQQRFKSKLLKLSFTVWKTDISVLVSGVPDQCQVASGPCEQQTAVGTCDCAPSDKQNVFSTFFKRTETTLNNKIRKDCISMNLAQYSNSK